jgi:hypothetical protein
MRFAENFLTISITPNILTSTVPEKTQSIALYS